MALCIVHVFVPGMLGIPNWSMIVCWPVADTTHVYFEVLHPSSSEPWHTSLSQSSGLAGARITVSPPLLAHAHA